MHYTYDLNSHELYHHGILGQKWGVRRYQDSDGSLTPEGRLRYKGFKGQKLKKADKRLTKQYDTYVDSKKAWKKAENEYTNAKKHRDKTLDYSKLLDKANKTEKELNDYLNKTGYISDRMDLKVYKNESDKKKGIIDKQGTELLKKFDKADDDYWSNDARIEQAELDVINANNKRTRALQKLGDDQLKFREQTDKYLNDWGEQKLNNLNLKDNDESYSAKFITRFMDDDIKVTSGDMDPWIFDAKYNGTSVKSK